MEAQNDIQLEAACTAHKTTSNARDCGRCRGPSELLPPGRAASEGLGEACPGVSLGAQTPEEMRAKIMRLESAILSLPQVDVPIEHYFAPGLYLREMRLAKGVAITGKIHKTEHYCILAKGDVTLVTEHGRERIQAPKIIHSMPGVKRAIHAHEDTVWINCHHNPSDERDVDKIDDIFVVDSFEQFLSFTEQKQIEGGK